MNHGLKLLKFLTIAAATVLYSSTAAADERIKEIPSASEIKSAKLAFYPMNINTYAPVTEADMLRNGCIYEIEENSDRISELSAILSRGITLSNKGEDHYQLRNVVYLNLRDGSKIRMLISDAHNLKPGVFGVIDKGQSSKHSYLTSDEKTLKLLRTWAKSRIEKNNARKFCEM